MTILLIDNSQQELALFELALKRIKVEAEFFGVMNCEQALITLNTKEIPVPDCIFIDIETQVIDANACLCMLKDSDNLKTVPVIIYSSEQEFSDVSYMMKHGVDGFLYKTRSFITFCDNLRSILLAEAA